MQNDFADRGLEVDRLKHIECETLTDHWPSQPNANCEPHIKRCAINGRVLHGHGKVQETKSTQEIGLGSLVAARKVGMYFLLTGKGAFCARNGEWRARRCKRNAISASKTALRLNGAFEATAQRTVAFSARSAFRNFSFLLTRLSLFLPSTEKLLNSSGRDLRRALFSLKQIFQVRKERSHNERRANCNARCHPASTRVKCETSP